MSLPSPPQDSFPDVGEAINDFRPCEEASNVVIMFDPESTLPREEESFFRSAEMH